MIVKSGRRICGTGAALANAPLVQDKSYFEVKIQCGGMSQFGGATYCLITHCVACHNLPLYPICRTPPTPSPTIPLPLLPPLLPPPTSLSCVKSRMRLARLMTVIISLTKTCSEALNKQLYLCHSQGIIIILQHHCAHNPVVLDILLP